MFKQEKTIFLTALMFLTRLPVPQNIDHSEAILQKCPRYFPLVGCLVGGISATAFGLTVSVFSLPLAILASIIAGIITTGCFHEDGFADVCDGFGGGWTKDRILEIMKDSRLGTYGVAGLTLMLASKFLLLQEFFSLPDFQNRFSGQILQWTVGLFLSAHALSRTMSVLVMQGFEYVTANDGSKSKPMASSSMSRSALLFTLITAVLPLLLLPGRLAFSLLPMLLAAFVLARYFKKWIGGYTGDCLGAIQQVAEIVFYASVVLLWKYL